MKKIVIIGGGAAGTALAANLDSSKFEIKIFEKRTADGNSGLAFLLLPNGFNVLCKMGLEKEILKKIHPLHTFKNQFSNGKKIKTEPMQYLFGAKRHDIVESVRSKVNPAITFYKHEFSHFIYDAYGKAIAVTFTNGHVESGDIFIGADGAFSKIRQTIFPESKLKKTHIKEIVSLVHAPELVNRLNGTFIKFTCKAGGRAAGLLPCSREHLVWFFQFNEQIINFNLEKDDMRSFLIHQIGSWGPLMEKVLIKTDFSKSFLWNTRDMDSLPSYHEKNVGLIGDAAHVFATFTSQGLNTALEDGYDLSELFNQQGVDSSCENIFQKFFKMRYVKAEQHLQIGRVIKNQFMENHHAPSEIMTPIAV